VPVQASAFNFLGFFVTLFFLEVARKPPQDLHAQRFVTRFHYLVFNVHRRLVPSGIYPSEKSNKKPRYCLNNTLDQVKKTDRSALLTPTRLPLLRGGRCSSAV